jgi:hypothetical protein
MKNPKSCLLQDNDNWCPVERRDDVQNHKQWQNRSQIMFKNSKAIHWAALDVHELTFAKCHPKLIGSAVVVVNAREEAHGTLFTKLAKVGAESVRLDFGLRRSEKASQLEPGLARDGELCL